MSVFIPGLGALYRLNDDWRLLAGVIFERYKEYGTDPYRDVHR